MSSSSPQVMVVTSDGCFYVYNIDLQKGGEGYLVKQFSYVQPYPILSWLPFLLTHIVHTVFLMATISSTPLSMVLSHYPTG